MKIGVSDASGKLGRAVVSELLRRGADVVGVSRSPDKMVNAFVGNTKTFRDVFAGYSA
ncbi:SDR family oxidoreductase [Asticcacaulis benevestitus]|uniref:NAD(P)-binding domain-containing protein n=1 Tax=Asticcacaulis benevestitus DSM 16100 = ATCC BAA-896 TaxID=1121022 RepID=V4P6D2_9CAUL|nr:SDR family oxidoreductase [Asticcacaulis benevestitus]ESQ83631.1 hypothetical protein ABENE_20175 [Asticcacaulis benevestitus DSM 16100 = ATCC BAA-896]